MLDKIRSHLTNENHEWVINNEQLRLCYCIYILGRNWALFHLRHKWVNNANQALGAPHCRAQVSLLFVTICMFIAFVQWQLESNKYEKNYRIYLQSGIMFDFKKGLPRMYCSIISSIKSHAIWNLYQFWDCAMQSQNLKYVQQFQDDELEACSHRNM